MAQERSRLKDVDALVEILLPSFQKPAALKYGEDMDASDTMPHILVANAALLQRIRAKQANLSISQADMVAALSKVYEIQKNDEAWTLQESHFEEWRTSMARRIRTMCRHYSQALCKTPPSAWTKKVESVARMSGDNATETSSIARSRPASSARPSRDSEQTFVYGWDKEVLAG